MNKLKLILPIGILLILLGIFWREVSTPRENPIRGSLVGNPLPAFSLASLVPSDTFLTNQELKRRVTLLHVWATWCDACKKEHPFLMELAENYHIPIYSIVYRDNSEAVKHWLNQHGNQFIKTGTDTNGSVAIDLGIYGTPETFVISPSGRILYRHVGMMNQMAWDNIIHPIFESYQ